MLEFHTASMDATQVFLYVASIASIVILILIAIAFYLIYKTLMRIQSFFSMAEGILAEMRLIKLGTALSGYRMLQSILTIFKKGGE